MSAGLPSSMYFYRLVANDIPSGQAADASTSSAQGFVETKEMMVIKERVDAAP